MNERRSRSLRGLALLGWLGVCLLAGFIGSIATGTTVDDWYRTLAKPAWTPPAWVFAPVWTTLYVLMGVAAWLVWLERPGRRRSIALGLFLVQLVLNVIWPVLFFALQMPALAALELLVLWGAILVTLVLFWRLRPLAGALLVPYLVWVSYAATLNIGIWWLN